MKREYCTIVLVERRGITKIDGPTSVWIAGKKKPPKREDSGWLEGTAEEVICLGFLLDIGDIREAVDSQ